MTSADRRDQQAAIVAEFEADQQAAPNPALLAPALDQDARTRSHLRAERALTPGPWHQAWPFVCPYCTDTFKTDRGYFPFCSPICAINAQEHDDE